MKNLLRRWAERFAHWLERKSGMKPASVLAGWEVKTFGPIHGASLLEVNLSDEEMRERGESGEIFVVVEMTGASTDGLELTRLSFSVQLEEKEGESRE